MSAVYLAGTGLVSCLGGNLIQSLTQLSHLPSLPLRRIPGLDQRYPYHAINSTETEIPPEHNWYERCALLIRQVALEAGVVDTSGALYLASSSLQAGAMENGDLRHQAIPHFLTDVAAMLDWQGPVYWVNSACTSCLNAVLMARQALTNGSIDEALIIGLELENTLSLAGFAGMQLLSHSPSQPMSAGRDGLVLGEAVAALRLSRQPGRWKIAGGAHMIDSSQVSGASNAAYQAMLTKVLQDAGIASSEVDLIKLQAAGSVANDAVEAQAIVDFFSDQPLPALVTLKPWLGHTLGACGAAEIALLLAMLEHGQWPRLDITVDPALGMTLANQPPERCRTLLASILGFGGSHACLALIDCV